MSGERGVTLPEVMLAGALAVGLALPAYALMGRTVDSLDRVESRFRLNAQARQAMTVLLEGGAPEASGVNGRRGYPVVEGLRSRCATPGSSDRPCTHPPPAGSALRTAYRLRLADGSAALHGDALGPFAVACRGTGDPLPDCSGTGTRSVGGWLGRDPVLAGTGRLRGLTLTLTDPWRLRRAPRAPGQASETFRTLVALQAEADP